MVGAVELTFSRTPRARTAGQWRRGLSCLRPARKLDSRWRLGRRCKPRVFQLELYRCHVGSCLKSNRKIIVTKFCLQRSHHGSLLKLELARAGIAMLVRRAT